MKNEYSGVLTGKGLNYGGSLVRKEATGYGLLYYVEAMMKDHGMELENKRAVISGSGNVAIYALKKAKELGIKVVAMSDSNGCILDEEGIDLALIQDIKEVKRGRIKEYLDYRPKAEYFEGSSHIWKIRCDIALPCATQNELDLEDAKSLVAGGLKVLAEGANMPTTPEAIEYLMKNGVLYAPGKAANAGGVATSGLEMSQNSLRLAWTFEEVNVRLKKIMQDIYANVAATAERYGFKDNQVIGANIAGFIKVADAMIEEGIV